MNGSMELQKITQKSRLDNLINSDNHNTIENMDMYTLIFITDNLCLACVSHSSHNNIESKGFHNLDNRSRNNFGVFSKIRREYADKQDLGTKFEKITKDFLFASWDVRLL